MLMGEMGGEENRLLQKHKDPFPGQSISPCTLYTKCEEARDISVRAYSLTENVVVLLFDSVGTN